MECRYCRSENAEDDHRCQRCGRRLRMTPVYTGQGGAAPQLETEDAPEPRIVAAEESAKRKLQVVAYQPTLFGPRDPALDQRRPAEGGILEARPSTPRPRARKGVATGQQSLEFSIASGLQHTEPAIYCDASVAITPHRLMAAAFDGAIVIAGLALFLGTFALCVSYLGIGSQLALTKQTLPFLGAIALLFGLLYNTLWALGNEDTPGMRWARLRLVSFDGNQPDREQRVCRLAAGCLSLMAAGLGLLWALVDEESLAWHDHMSKTFPTPY